MHLSLNNSPLLWCMKQNSAKLRSMKKSFKLFFRKAEEQQNWQIKEKKYQPDLCFKSFSVHIMSSKLASYYSASHNLEKLVKLDMLIPFNQLKSHVGHWAVWMHVFSLNRHRPLCWCLLLILLFMFLLSLIDVYYYHGILLKVTMVSVASLV